MSLVNDVYSDVCNVMMEPLPTGLSLGVVTQQQFLDMFADVFFDFLQATGLTKKLISIPVSAGVSQYQEPPNAMVAQEVFYGNRYIFREDAMDLDYELRTWRSQNGSPRMWHEDRLGVKIVELAPTPLLTGMIVGYTDLMFGTVSSTAGAVDFDFTPNAPWFGTISIDTGSCYIEFAGSMLGTIGTIVSSTGNLELVTTTKGTATAFSLTDIIQFLPDSFVPYIKYGVLAKIFSSDSEAKDVLRARYCQARYQEGTNLAKAIMQEAEVD